MNEADPVRVELDTALRRDITILPVLLDGTSMPDPAELPENIRDFAYRNALEVESGRDFNVHIERLIRAIEQILGVKAKAPQGSVSPLLGPVPPTKKGWVKPLRSGLPASSSLPGWAQRAGFGLPKIKKRRSRAQTGARCRRPSATISSG